MCHKKRKGVPVRVSNPSESVVKCADLSGVGRGTVGTYQYSINSLDELVEEGGQMPERVESTLQRDCPVTRASSSIAATSSRPGYYVIEYRLQGDMYASHPA